MLACQGHRDILIVLDHSRLEIEAFAHMAGRDGGQEIITNSKNAGRNDREA